MKSCIKNISGVCKKIHFYKLLAILFCFVSYSSYAAIPLHFELKYCDGRAYDSPEEACSNTRACLNEGIEAHRRNYLGVTSTDDYGDARFACEISYLDGETEHKVTESIIRWGTCGGSGKVYLDGEGCRCSPPFEEDENGECVKLCEPSTPLLDLGGGGCYADPEPMQCTAANPINISTGEKIQIEEPDYSENRVLPLDYRRDYRSRRAPESNPDRQLQLRDRVSTAYAKANGWAVHRAPTGYVPPVPLRGELLAAKPVQLANGAYTSPPAGYKQWRHSFQYRLYPWTRNDISYVRLFRPDKTILRFKKEGAVFKSESYKDQTVVPTANGYTYQPTPTITETYNSEGYLTRIENNDGIYQTFSYNATDKLASVSHSLGGSIDFTYNEQGLTDTVTFPNGVVMQQHYDDDFGNLTSVVKTLPVVDGDPQVTTRTYHYEDERFPYALTGITDERGVRYASWAYDERGRAIASWHGSGNADRYSFDFSESLVTALTNPLGKETRYIYSKDTGTKRLARVEGVASENCAAANKEYEYYDNGFLKAKTDWKNNRTTYVRDEYGREISRTEAAGTPEARTITTDWHDSLPLKSRIGEPELVIEYGYDDGGKVTSITTKSK